MKKSNDVPQTTVKETLLFFLSFYNFYSKKERICQSLKAIAVNIGKGSALLFVACLTQAGNQALAGTPTLETSFVGVPANVFKALNLRILTKGSQSFCAYYAND